MTTAVYKDGAMLADSRAYGWDSNPVGVKTKVTRTDRGLLICTSTRALGAPAAVAEWVKKGMNRADIPAGFDECEFETLIVRPDGVAWIMDEGFYPTEVHGPHYCLGSGKEYAMGVLWMGGTAAQAVKAACELDIYSAMPIEGFDHEGRRYHLVNSIDVRAWRGPRQVD